MADEGSSFQPTPPHASGHEVSINTEHKWVRLCYTAVVETDWSRIEEHIQAAESAISDRLHEFSLNHGGTPEENQTIANAVMALEALRNDVATWRLKQG
jgi:hypothetical protein